MTMGSFLKGTVVAAFVVLLVGTSNPGPSSPAREESSATVEAQDANRPPERLRSTVDTSEVAPSGRTIAVPADGDLQAALDDARPGDVIQLEPRATYRGPFRLPRKAGNQWIVLSTAAKDLPHPGRHVDPSHASLMPKLVASSGSVFSADRGAHHYRLVGLEIAPADDVSLKALVELGSDETSLNDLPHHIVIDRCYLHGDRKRGSRRGIAMNSRDTAVVDSYLSDFKEAGADSQAIGGWNGAGPFRIANNYLEAAGENVMFGGADPTISGLVPSDIEIVRNHLAKPLSWKIDHPTFAGVKWSVKNLFELKNARRVLIDGNLFEYNWPQDQNGFAILFTVRNQDGRAPWSTIEDVTFQNNVVRHVAAGINVLGRDDNFPSQQVRRMAIRNNLFLDIGGRWGNGRLFQLLDGTAGVTIDHNTAFQTGSILFGGDHAPHTAFVFQNNVVPHNEYGITGSGTDVGSSSLARYFPNAVVRRNVIVGGRRAQYPADNFFPESLDEAGLATPRAGRLRLTLARPYARAGTDGHDPGADVDTVSKALGGIASVGLNDNEASADTRRDGAQTIATRDSATAALAVFWIVFALLGYVYAGYPVVAGLRARLRQKPRCRAPIEPTVSIIVVAHNEADCIAARIQNLLDLDYPRDRVAIMIGSDGSTDDTVERASRYQNLGVQVRAFRNRRGKPAVINALAPLARSDIVVFADARQRFDRRALRALVANFADPAVGAVSGELVLTTSGDAPAAGQGATFYWRYETFIRSMESRADSTVGATGAIYAIRRELFEPVPDDTILDDVLIPLGIIRRGYRVLFEPEARAYDRPSASAGQEFVRKARTIAGTFQLFARQPWLLHPRRNRLWFETVSHKALRLALPVLHAALLGVNVALTGMWMYRWTMAAQVVFYAAALVGCAQHRTRRRAIVFSVPCTICLLSWATVIGFIRFATNRQQVTWEKVPAPAMAPAEPPSLPDEVAPAA
jgi:cellulose synthase/poly-beta-1,6-N-acetylglucosamine synthase-like glycosyltransferase